MKKNSLNCDIVPKGGWVKGSKPHFFSKLKCGQRLGEGGSETFLSTFQEVVLYQKSS